MEADFQEYHDNNLPLDLCIKFAGLLIDMVRRVKANRTDPKRNMYQEQHGFPEYFIHTNDLKQLFNQAHNPLRILVPLSVGQPYHEAASAASQVACLQNCRDAYELWIQDQLKRKATSPQKISLKWYVALVVADVTQALNRVDPVEIDFNIPHGQCNALLNDEKLTAYEREYIEKGRELEKHYHQLFTEHERTKQKDVEITLRIKGSLTIRWAALKRHYSTPTVVEIINRLEYAFKLGARAIMERKPEDKKKFPSEIEKLYQNGVFHNWTQDVKVNDLAYVDIETLMIHCKILPMPAAGETQSAAMMYPGPLNMILDTGKKLLSCICKDVDKKVPISTIDCIYLQAEKVNSKKEAKQDKNASLFSGKLEQHGARSFPDEDLSRARMRFIDTAVPQGTGNQFVIAALNATIIKQNEQNAEKQSNFELGPYAAFITLFSEEYPNYDDLISQLRSENKLPWNYERPLLSIHQFFSETLNHTNEVIGSQQTMSMSDSFLDHDTDQNVSLVLKLGVLESRYSETKSKEKHREYLIKAACRLVCCAVQFQKDHSIDVRPQGTKKSKSTSIPFFPQPDLHDEDEIEVQEIPVPISRPGSESLPVIGCFFYIKSILDTYDIDIALLCNYKYYPHPVPEADYHSTQSSQHSGSVPLSRTGSFPLSQSGSFPLGQSK